jgi:cell growth-regulating nucleolar protein
LLLHAEGKKHRVKARAFHAKNQPTGVTQETSGVPVPPTDAPVSRTGESNTVNGQNHFNGNLQGKEKSVKRKREDRKTDEQNGQVAEVKNVEPTIEKKKKVKGAKEDGDSEIKWKKIVTSILKSVNPPPPSPMQGEKTKLSVFHLTK